MSIQDLALFRVRSECPRASLSLFKASCLNPPHLASSDLPLPSGAGGPEVVHHLLSSVGLVGLQGAEHQRTHRVQLQQKVEKDEMGRHEKGQNGNNPNNKQVSTNTGPRSAA